MTKLKNTLYRAGLISSALMMIVTVCGIGFAQERKINRNIDIPKITEDLASKVNDLLPIEVLQKKCMDQMSEYDLKRLMRIAKIVRDPLCCMEDLGVNEEEARLTCLKKKNTELDDAIKWAEFIVSYSMKYCDANVKAHIFFNSPICFPVMEENEVGKLAGDNLCLIRSLAAYYYDIALIEDKCL